MERKYPSNEEFCALLRTYKAATGREKQKAANTILKGLHFLILKQIRAMIPWGNQQDEAYANCLDTLFRCTLDRWDEAKMAAAGGRFSSYATMWIRAAIIRTIQQHNTPMVLTPGSILMVEYHSAHSQRRELPEMPKMIWLDKHWYESRVTVDSIGETDDLMERMLVREGMTQDGVPVNDGRNMMELVDEHAQLEQVHAEIPNLPERERRVLQLRLEGLTLNEIGQSMGGLSRERTRQLESAAIKRLQKRLRNRKDN